MLEQTYLSSGQRAALYELMADTPGFAAVPHAADITGRPGIGIAWQAPGGSGRNMIIFDATTYAELGITTWGAHHEKGGGALLKPPFSLRMLNGCRLVSAPWLGRPVVPAQVNESAAMVRRASNNHTGRSGYAPILW